MSKGTLNDSSATVRINLEVSEDIRNHIRSLKVRSKAASISEVFKRSLALYDLVIDHISKGGKVVLEGPNDQREVIRIL
jgi:hypothetical protein